MARISEEAAVVLAAALLDQTVIKRYRSNISPVPMRGGCLIWCGALSGRGHARFWIGNLPDGRDVTVLAHRFGYGLVHGFDELMATQAVRHDCDNPLCQEPSHWRAGTNAENAHDWVCRREVPGSPLRDARGSIGRARALRDAARAGEDLEATSARGLARDQDQLPLF